MADNKDLVEGLRFFEPRQGAPDFVKGTLVVSVDDFTAWLTAQPGSDYNGKKQVKLQLLESQAGKMYLKVDNYVKPDGGAQPGYAPSYKASTPDYSSDLPF